GLQASRHRCQKRSYTSGRGATRMKGISLRAIKAYVTFLNRRLSAGVHTTEDSIRYTFYAALLEEGVRPEDVILEDRHSNIERALVDTLILDANRRPAIAIEFKYDRSIPGGGNQP